MRGDWQFTCDVVPDRDIVYVKPRGELDIATISVVDRTLTDLHEAGFDQLVLDLREVSFMDAGGPRLVQRWIAAAQTGGFSFRVTPGKHEVQRVFEVTGMADLLAG